MTDLWIPENSEKSYKLRHILCSQTLCVNGRWNSLSHCHCQETPFHRFRQVRPLLDILQIQQLNAVLVKRRVLAHHRILGHHFALLCGCIVSQILLNFLAPPAQSRKRKKNIAVENDVICCPPVTYNKFSALAFGARIYCRCRRQFLDFRFVLNALNLAN